METPLLEIRDVKKVFSGKKGTWKGNYSKSGGFH